MQHEKQYPSPSRPSAGKAFGEMIGWSLIGLVGILIASGLIAGIVALWRVIL